MRALCGQAFCSLHCKFRRLPGGPLTSSPSPSSLPLSPSSPASLPFGLGSGASLSPAPAHFPTPRPWSLPGAASALEGCDSLFFELAPELLSARKERPRPGQSDIAKNGHQALLTPCQACPPPLQPPVCLC